MKSFKFTTFRDLQFLCSGRNSTCSRHTCNTIIQPKFFVQNFVYHHPRQVSLSCLRFFQTTLGWVITQKCPFVKMVRCRRWFRFYSFINCVMIAVWQSYHFRTFSSFKYDSSLILSLERPWSYLDMIFFTLLHWNVVNDGGSVNFYFKWIFVSFDVPQLFIDRYFDE